eukprot:TRINITY_DN77459_c0_g1_i1.p3 TRINITY_DN77459_c0_g1~~TRINITY_DN77459_c0_g1_i1.p3  ORF type:complete len:108 (-),score=31.81 TRINITY_DN77459_c0_g1_i1:15-338(-)
MNAVVAVVENVLGNSQVSNDKLTDKHMDRFTDMMCNAVDMLNDKGDEQNELWSERFARVEERLEGKEPKDTRAEGKQREKTPNDKAAKGKDKDKDKGKGPCKMQGQT